MGAPRLDRLDKNYIINGNFDFWQRNTGSLYSGTGSSSGYAWADRWRYSAISANNRANRQVDRSTDVPTFAESGFRSTYSMQYSQTSALVLTAPDHISWCQQRVEGFFYSNLHGKDITVSFWFKSTLAGQYPIAFANSGLSRSYVTLFAYDNANVWQKIYVTIPTDSSGTWLFDSGIGLDIIIACDTGGNADAPSLNTWLSGTYIGAASGVQVQAQTSITMNIAQIQLSDAAFKKETFSLAGRDYTEELRLCQRYFEKSYNLETVLQTPTGVGSWVGIQAIAGGGGLKADYKVRKRAIAVVTIYNPATGTPGQVRDYDGSNDTATQENNGETGLIVRADTVAGGEAFIYHFGADAEL